MKRSRNVLILVIALVVLSGVYIFLNKRPVDKNEGIAEEKIEISKFDKDEIVKMVLKSENGTLTFNKVEKEVVKENEDGEKETVIESEWEVDYPYPVTLRQITVDDIAYSFASLYAQRVIEEETPEDLAPYGLDKPKVVAEATLKDGSKKVLYLGNRTPAGNTYYLMAEGDPRVFEVWMNHGQHFSYTLSDVRDKSLPEINTQELTYLKMHKKDGRPVEIKINDDQSEEEAQFGLGLWKMTQPYNEPMGVNGENFQTVLYSISRLAIEDFINDDPEDLSKYGLDDPSAELIVKDKENTLHLYFGDDFEDDKIYFKIADSKAVYAMDKDDISFMETKPFDLVQKFTYIVNIDNVDKIIVEGRGKTHTLILERTIKKAEEEGKEDEEITTYYVDGKEVEEDPFKDYYQSLIGILADAENNKELEEDNPEVKTTFFLNVGSKREVHVNYVPYNDDFYAVFRSGKAEFLVHKSQVEKMLDMLDALISGELGKEE